MPTKDVSGETLAKGLDRLTTELTEDGREEFKALRAEVLERLRSQQQMVNYALLVLGLAGTALATLVGRVDPQAISQAIIQVSGVAPEAAWQLTGSLILLPVTLLGLFFAVLSVVFVDHEFAMAMIANYIGRELRMPWESRRHGHLRSGIGATLGVENFLLSFSKYLTAFVPACALLVITGWRNMLHPFGIPSVFDAGGALPVTKLPMIFWISGAALMLLSVVGLAWAQVLYHGANASVEGPVLVKPVASEGSEGSEGEEGRAAPTSPRILLAPSVVDGQDSTSFDRPTSTTPTLPRDPA